MSYYLGIDTSNYTTSLAVFDDSLSNPVWYNHKKLLPVSKGNLGLRQSDALFHHVKQLPQVMEQLVADLNANEVRLSQIKAIGVSTRPRDVEGSYMPCFLAGKSLAEELSLVMNIPVYSFSHQRGHISAAVLSSSHTELLNKQFIAFHVSGGTTEILYCSPSSDNVVSVEIIGKSLDLHAGQLIDRVGTMLGMQFPCGKYVDELANKSTKKFRIHPCIKNLDFCLSGVENKCKEMINNNDLPEDICLYTLEYIKYSLDKVISKITKLYPSLPLVFSGGVMCNSIIKTYIKDKYQGLFAEPMMSSDNAVGIAYLTKMESDKNAE